MIKTWLSVARGSDLPTNLGAVFRRSARNRVPWRGFVRARACALRVYWGRMRLKKTRENNRHSCNGHRGFLAGGGGEWLPDHPIRVSEKNSGREGRRRRTLTACSSCWEPIRVSRHRQELLWCPRSAGHAIAFARMCAPAARRALRSPSSTRRSAASIAPAVPPQPQGARFPL